MSLTNLKIDRGLYRVVPRGEFLFPLEWHEMFDNTVFSSEAAAVEAVKILMEKSYFWGYVVKQITCVGLKATC